MKTLILTLTMLFISTIATAQELDKKAKVEKSYYYTYSGAFHGNLFDNNFLGLRSVDNFGLTVLGGKYTLTQTGAQIDAIHGRNDPTFTGLINIGTDTLQTDTFILTEKSDNQLAIYNTYGDDADDLVLSIDSMGTVSMTGNSTNRLLLPQSNDVVTPTLTLGTNNSGFYAWTNDIIAIGLAGALRYSCGAVELGIYNDDAEINFNNVADITLSTTGLAVEPGFMVNTGILSTTHTLSIDSCYGYVLYVTGARTITLPAIAVGMSITFITIGANAISIDVDDADLQYLDGVALADGDKATNTSTAGDMITYTYYDATGWYSASNGWSDGN